MGSTHLGDEHVAFETAGDELRTTAAIRSRAGQLLKRARAGESQWFIVDDGFRETAAQAIVKASHHWHGRINSLWRHFEAGGVDRRKQIEEQMSGLKAAQKAHTLLDLAIVGALLGDGDGVADWKYIDTASGKTFAGAEGLALATFHAFTAGLFSSDAKRPLQADSEGLRALVTAHLAEAFQISDRNRLGGMEDRAVLLRRLGEVIAEQPEVFGDEIQRPGGMFDMLVSPLGPEEPPHTADITAHSILSQLLRSLSGIWPVGNAIGGVPLGDCWRHPAVRGPGLTDGWMPFHERSQWMTYSMLEPFEWCGVKVLGVQLLTALPDERTCRFLVDKGVLRLRDESAAAVWKPGDEFTVEWRALTVALMDDVADAARMPLARVVIPA